MNHAQFWGGAAAPYEIEQSLRFDGSGYLTHTPSSASSTQTKLTISYWHKGILSTVPSDSAYHFHAVDSSDSNNTWNVRHRSAQSIQIRSDYAGTSSRWGFFPSAVHRDPSAWYHYVISVDTTQATGSDRVKFWVNGVLQSGSASPSYPSQNDTQVWNRAVARYIGSSTTGGSYTVEGYMAELHSVDGTALDHEDFGEFDDNGVWRPIRYTGSHGTNGFYLKFDPDATNGVGHDHSGNGNNFTATGFTTSGTGTDVMDDTPTTNWCTLNPLDNGGNTVSNGNLVVNTSAGFDLIRSTFFLSSGKWYWEVTADDGGDGFVGISSAEESLSSRGAETANSATILTTNGNIRTSASNSAYGSAVSDGDVMMFALDMDAGKFWAGKNGTWFNSGDPAAGTNAGKTGLTVPVSPSISVYDNEDYTANFGQRDFAYTPPTGYKALNTANLPAPDIADGSEYFNTVLYTGNSSTQSITGVGFQPDWVWAKSRDEGYSHYVYDVVRGAGRYINTNNTNTEVNDTTTLSSFDTDGFSLGSAPGTNNNTKRYVAWNWLAGNGTSSNTDGTITSTVSANPTAGFSIVSYTGNATSGATIGHGLGVAPSMVIVKNRDDGTTHWHVYHEAVGNTKYVLLSIDNVATTASNRWNDTSPSSTVVTLGDHVSVNGSSDNMIAYCFAEVEGYSKISEFTGNGSTDGSFVYCGFKPSWILLRRYAASRNWYLYDAARNTFNVVGNVLYPDLSNAEASADALDILSNGFKMRTTNTSINGSGDKILFVAFASNPFGGSGVSPATAR